MQDKNTLNSVATNEKSKSRFTVKRLIVDSLMLATLVICSLISINAGSSPITMQVFGIYLIIILLPSVDSVLVILTYTIMGTIGLPVFAGGTAGSFASATYGFIIGFLVSSIVCYGYSLLFKNFREKHHYLIDLTIKAIIFIAVIYLIGLPYCAAIAGMSIPSAILYFLPFVGIDACKIVVAMIVYKRLSDVVKF